MQPLAVRLFVVGRRLCPSVTAAQTPTLIDAVKRQDAAAVRRLLSARANVNARSRRADRAPLGGAAQQPDLVDLLLAAGANAKAHAYNVTPLYLAAERKPR